MRLRITPTRAFLWATFLTPLVLLGGYFARSAKVLPLRPQTGIVSQNGQMMASRQVAEDGKEMLWVYPAGMSSSLWIMELPFNSPVALSPDGRYLITGESERDPLLGFPTSPLDYTLACRDTTTRGSVWKRLEQVNDATTPLGANAVTVSPDSSLVAVAVVEGIRVYSLHTGEFVRFINTAPNNLDPDVQLRFSSDGQTLTATQASGTREFEMRF